MRFFYIVWCAVLMRQALGWGFSFPLKTWLPGNADASVATDEFQLEIDDAKIELILARKKFSLIYFYTTTCGYCNKFNPDFVFLSQLFNDRGNTVNQENNLQILKTNAKDNKRLAQLFAISSYPSLKLVNFETKEIFTFEDKRSVDNIVKFLEYHTDSTPNYDNYKSTVINVSDDNMEGFLEPSTAASPRFKVIAFAASFHPDWEKPHYPQHFYQKFTQHYPNHEFAIANIEDANTVKLQRQYRVSNSPSIVLIDSERGTIRTYQTNSPSSYLSLSESQCKMFLDSLDDPVEGFVVDVFDNIDNLQSGISNNAADVKAGYQQVKAKGFNIVHSPSSDMEEKSTLEQEYEELLNELHI